MSPLYPPCALTPLLPDPTLTLCTPLVLVCCPGSLWRVGMNLHWNLSHKGPSCLSGCAVCAWLLCLDPAQAAFPQEMFIGERQQQPPPKPHIGTRLCHLLRSLPVTPHRVAGHLCHLGHLWHGLVAMVVIPGLSWAGPGAACQ